MAARNWGIVAADTSKKRPPANGVRWIIYIAVLAALLLLLLLAYAIGLLGGREV